MFGVHIVLFHDKVYDVLNIPMLGCSMFKLLRKLKFLKHELSKLHNQQFSNIMAQVQEHRNILHTIQSQLQSLLMEKICDMNKEEWESNFKDPHKWQNPYYIKEVRLHGPD